MTTTDRTVRRRTRHKYNVLFNGSKKARTVVCSIIPGDVLEFRESGRRARFTLAIDTAFKYAVRLAAFAAAAEKARAKKRK